jgi:hypothetical protein
MMPRTLRRLAPLILVPACAVTAPPAGPDAPVRPSIVEQRDGTYTVALAPDRSNAEAVLPAGVDAVFPLVADAYQEIGISIETLDTTRRIIGNPRFRARQRLAGMPMETVVRCGDGPTGPHARSFLITFDIHTQVMPSGAGKSMMRTMVSATGRSIEGATTHEITCASTGALEQRILEIVSRRLGGA